MDYLDTQLQLIQEEELTEFDPLTGAAIAGTSYLIGSLAFLFLAIGPMISALKVDKPLSKRLNEILNSGNHWIVHTYPEKTPNAFALGMGRHVFITTGLLELLNQREVEAVMLHEIHHNKNKDTYKSLAYRHSFFYLITFLALSINSLTLSLFAFVLMFKITEILRNRMLGRHLEIKADRFSAEHGYGKDLITALEKIDKYIKKLYASKPCGKMCELERKISEMIDEHPPMKKRVEIILRESDKILKMKTFKQVRDFIARTFKQNG